MDYQSVGEKFKDRSSWIIRVNSGNHWPCAIFLLVNVYKLKMKTGLQQHANDYAIEKLSTNLEIFSIVLRYVSLPSSQKYHSIQPSHINEKNVNSFS